MRVDPGQEAAAAVEVGSGDGVDEQLDGLADLTPERVGDIGLGADRLGEERFGLVSGGDAGEPAGAERRDEGVEEDWLGAELRGPPSAGAGGDTSVGVDEGEMVPVGDECQGDPVMSTGQGSTLNPGRWPGVAGRASVRVSARRKAEHENSRSVVGRAGPRVVVEATTLAAFGR